MTEKLTPTESGFAHWPLPFHQNRTVAAVKNDFTTLMATEVFSDHLDAKCFQGFQGETRANQEQE
jgi:hypothetical protein